MLLIATAFNLSVVGITGISGDRQKSLAIDLEIKHRQGEATSLNNIGSVYRQLQQTEKAIKKYQGGQYLVGCG